MGCRTSCMLQPVKHGESTTDALTQPDSESSGISNDARNLAMSNEQPDVDAPAMRRSRTEQTIERQTFMLDLAGRMADVTDTDKLLDMLVSSAAEVLHCDRVHLFVRSGDQFTCRYGHPQVSGGQPAVHLTDQELLSVADTGKTLRVTSITNGYPSASSTPDPEPKLCGALRNGSGEVMGIVLASGKHAHAKGDGFLHLDETALDLLLAFATRQLRVCELTRARRKSDALLDCLLSINVMRASGAGNVQLRNVVSTILAHMHPIVECDRCTLFIVDNLNDKLLGFFTIDKDGSKQLHTLHIPMQGIAEVVARGGELLNIKHAWSDKRFSTRVDLETGYRTETILCAPLITSNNKTIAVFQCINKLRHQHFDDDDEQMLMAISAQLSDLLQRLILDATYDSFIRLNKDIDADIKDMIFLERSQQTRRASTIAMQNQLSKKKTVMPRKQQADLDVLTVMQRWDLNSWSDIDAYNAYQPYIFACMEYFDVFASFSLAKNSLSVVMKTMQARYSTTNQYHNWTHAFGTFHATFLMLDSAAFGGVLPEASVLSLLLAALGHDVEHPGVTNAFLVNAEDALALRYNDVAVLENHHAAVTCGILKNSDPYIFEDCVHEVRNHIRKLVVASILGTDMAKHQEIVASLETSNFELQRVREEGSKLPKENALQLSVALLHCADISHPMLPWNVHKHISKLICEEFHAQYTEEQRLGLPSLPFMGKDPNSVLATAPTQVGFIQFVVTPLFSAMSFIAGENLLVPLMNNLNNNRKNWQELADGKEVAEEEQPFETPRHYHGRRERISGRHSTSSSDYMVMPNVDHALTG
eukprot:TRINITY_DN14493_c0_g3_i1.p1 TRINITY_DN14493_c0_g3~~TRINITY_DN14493_c0_g3_i1.p1  ORF type:complete len:817 (+),score=141.38 TRINITY_DN14493_c0_g3_i1:75-2525(+)